MSIHSVVRTIAPEQKRRAVLDAALDLFAHRTYGATPIPELATAAGVAAGTIYRYFPSKEALANEVYRGAKQALADAILGDLEPGLSPREEFERWWGGLVRFAKQRPDAFAYLETHCHDPYLDDESREVAAALDAAAADFVRRSQRAGMMRSGPPDVLVAMVFGAFVGLHKHARLRGRSLSRNELDTARDATWHMVAA